MRVCNSDDPFVPTWAVFAVLAAAVLVLIGAATPPGAAVAGAVQAFLLYYVGVFTLLTMTGAVVTGLLATDRAFMGIRARVYVQAMHRAFSILAMMSVIAHFTCKILAGKAAAFQIVVPTQNLVGVGTLAFETMVLIVITGILRARFAEGAKPWVWRTLHSIAYVSWPLGVVHGLLVGRPATYSWINLAYVLCGGAVALALVTRLVFAAKPRQIRYAGDNVTVPVARRVRDVRGQDFDMDAPMPMPMPVRGGGRDTEVLR